MESKLTRSLTILPSSLATATLRTVLRTKKKECKTTIMLSFDLHDGKATRNRIARSCFRKALSMLGFVLVAPERGSKYDLSALYCSSDMERIGTYVRARSD